LVANDGLEAWNVVQNHLPDLIISDILMPHMDGFELCRKIKTDSRLKNIPIIIYSATYVESRDQHLAMASGASKFITKPIEPKEMLQQVAETLSDHAFDSTLLDESIDNLDARHARILQDKLQKKLNLLSKKNNELEQEKEMLELSLDVSGMAAFRWNAQYDEFYGYPHLNKLLFGKEGNFKGSYLTLLELTHPEDKSIVIGAFDRLKQTNQHVTIRFRYLRAQQTQAMLELNAKKYNDNSMTVLGTLMDVNANQLANITSLIKQREVDYAKEHDTLTGLPNRTAFVRQLEEHILALRGSNSGFGIMLLDLDNFKLVNDSLGNLQGDKLIQVIGHNLREHLLSTHTLFRIGGDEFAIILPKLDNAELIASYAKKLLLTIAKPVQVADQKFNITSSIGIALYPQHGDNANALISAADNATYEAKNLFGNRAIVFSKDMSKLSDDRIGIKQGLLPALEKNQFELYYQPKLDLKNNQIVGAEALIRWNHPLFGLIAPDRFIGIAEQSGSIVPIGRWVIRQALTEPLFNQLARQKKFSLSVNLSIRQFSDEGLVSFLKDTLAQTNFPPECLELEITESTVQVLGESVSKLLELKKLGIQIAIDDFGTGYSSFSSLKYLMVDRLKVDKIFVKEIARNKKDFAILGCIINLANALAIHTTIEGVETKQQLELVKQLDCDEYQGYYFSKPLPIAGFTALITNAVNPVTN
jgi:diguanylate cyclase (GGDEF)-like protein